MLNDACCLIATAPAADSLNRATLFLGLLLAMLTVLFLSIALLTMKRSFDRRRETERKRERAAPDPWREAGKRVQPYEPKNDR